MTARWYTIQLQPQLLETADFNLRRQNFTPFFPRVEIRKSKKVTITEPMFRGYGFVMIDLEVDQWLSVNGTRGVIGLLPRHLLLPLAMPIGFVETLQAKDPLPESDFLDAFDEYFPGITEVEVLANHRHLGGRRGVVVDIRAARLQVCFYTNSRGYLAKESNGLWLDKDAVVPIKA